jgi:hypothetical protein
MSAAKAQSGCPQPHAFWPNGAPTSNPWSATGPNPVAFNAPGMRETPATFGILRELGLVYCINDLSRNEPFLTAVRNKPS